MDKYLNETKSQARGWAWNQLCKRIPHKFHRRKARVYCLIGDTTKELEIAERKDFSRLNVIGVDIRKDPVKKWREAGGIAIQAPIEAVIAMSNIRPQGVIVDFCAGLNEKTFLGFMTALLNTTAPGAIIINLMRGRDDIKSFRSESIVQTCAAISPNWEVMLKRRSIVLLMQLFNHLVLTNPSKQDDINYMKNLVDQPGRRAIRQLDMYFLDMFEEFMRKVKPSYHEYKSKDSNQYFDTLAIDSFIGKAMNIPKFTDAEVTEEMPHVDVPHVRRLMGAMEAVRTQRINQLPERKRMFYLDDEAA